MKYLIFFFLFVANIGIFGEDSTPTVFVSKNPYATTETYNTPRNKTQGLMNLSVTKVTPQNISGVISEKNICFSPEDTDSLEYFPITSLEKLNLKNIGRSNSLLKKNKDNTLSINRNSFKGDLYLLGINKKNNHLEKLYQYKEEEKEIIKTINVSIDTFGSTTYFYNRPYVYWHYVGAVIKEDLSQYINILKITGDTFDDLKNFNRENSIYMKDEAHPFTKLDTNNYSACFIGYGILYQHFYPINYTYSNTNFTGGFNFKGGPTLNNDSNSLILAFRDWDGTDFNHTYDFKAKNEVIRLNIHLKPLPDHEKGTLNITFDPKAKGVYSFNRLGQLISTNKNISYDFSGSKYFSPDYGDKLIIDKTKFYKNTSIKSNKVDYNLVVDIDTRHCYTPEKTFELKDSTFKIFFDKQGNFLIEPIKLGKKDIAFPIKIYRKEKLVGDFTVNIINSRRGKNSLQINPNKTVDSNYSFDSNGNQLSGDKNFKLSNNDIPSGDSIDKFKIESDLGTQEKNIEEGKDNLLEFQKNGNIFKIGFDKNKNFNISLVKASSKNLDFNFKLIGSCKDEVFETFDFTLKRKPLDHKNEQLNMVLNNPSEYLLSNRDQGILLGKNLQPYGKDEAFEKNIAGTGAPIDTDFSSRAHLRILKFKDREYEVNYDPQEDAYVTEPIEIGPNFKSSFYLSSKNGTFGFKKNLQWNGEEVKENFTYLEYNSLGETCTEHSIDLNIKKFLPKTGVIEVSIPSGLTLPFEITIDSQGNPSNREITMNHQGEIPYLNRKDSKIICTIGDKKSDLSINNPLFSINEENKKYTAGYKNSQLYLNINSIDLTASLDETIVLSHEVNNSLNNTPVQRANYKIILKRKPTFISIEGDTMDFGDMITKGGIYYGKSKIILTNTENKIVKTKVTNPDCFLVNENNPEDKLPIKDINLTDVLNTSLNTSIFYIQGTVNVTDQGPGNYKGNIILELTLD